MIMIEKNFRSFKIHVNKVIYYLEANFGKGDYLKMKNEGILLSRNYEIKSSEITGYSFHGYGCGFQFSKKHEIDIEFHDREVGFTAWGFRSFLIDRGIEISEKKVEEYLREKLDLKVLKYTGRIYVFR